MDQSELLSSRVWPPFLLPVELSFVNAGFTLLCMNSSYSHSLNQHLSYLISPIHLQLPHLDKTPIGRQYGVDFRPPDPDGLYQ